MLLLKSITEIRLGICAGEINIGNGSSFASAAGVNNQAKGLNVESGKEVSLEGTTYFLQMT